MCTVLPSKLNPNPPKRCALALTPGLMGKECPSRTGLARVGGNVQLAGWRVSGRPAVRLGVESLAAVPGRD